MKAQPAIGTCDGTGAQMYICCGFIPRHVVVRNVDSGNFERLEWFKEFGIVASNANEGILLANTSSADQSKLAVSTTTQQGIREYAGGDRLTYDGTTNSRWEYGASSAAAAEVFLDGQYTRDTATDTAFQCIGSKLLPSPTDGAKVDTPAGFSIGANSAINVNGEQLTWIATP
jgi:hypothetical protein